MVAQFPVAQAEITAPPQNLTPEIKTTVNTFVSFNPISLINQDTGETRTCNITINITNLTRSHAVNAFSRIFDYVQSIATNDLNPVFLANQNPISPTDAGNVFSPTGICNISVNMLEIIPTIKLSLQISNLRLDYMDEYFNSTLTYLTNAIANDLNPGA